MPHLRRFWSLVAAASALVLFVAGCGAGAASDESGESVTVFAAASLTEAFTRIGKDFERTHPGIDLRFNFAGSSTLAQQLIRGAPADVFASANQAQMRKVADADLLAAEPEVFVRNKLQIVVPAGNPGKVSGLADFGDKERTIAICAPQVPCGAAAQEAFAAAGVEPAPDTLEQDVKAVLTKVALGEVDAGLVYRSDVVSAERDVRGIDFPVSGKAVNSYSIATLADAPSAAAAEAFLDYVQSPQAMAVLDDHGFITS